MRLVELSLIMRLASFETGGGIQFQFEFIQYFQYSRTMEMFEALEAFASLSQETRLRVFKLLVEYGCDGLVPGKIASELKIPDNTLSFHLSHMSKAGLVTSKKAGRSITYFANCGLMDDLIEFIQANCCAQEDKSGRKRKIQCERKC